jgi:hypothetical protein
MPWLLAAISGLIFSRAGAWIAGALAALGIGLTVQLALFDQLMEYAQQGFSGLPANAAAWIGALNIDRYVSLVISGYLGASAKRIIMKKIAS